MLHGALARTDVQLDGQLYGGLDSRTGGSLRKDTDRVRPEPDVPVAGHPLRRSRARRRVVADIAEVAAEAARVRIETQIPGARAREADVVAREGLIAEVHDHDDVVAGAAPVPAVVGDDAVGVARPEDVNVAAAQAPGVAV